MIYLIRLMYKLQRNNSELVVSSKHADHVDWTYPLRFGILENHKMCRTVIYVPDYHQRCHHGSFCVWAYQWETTLRFNVVSHWLSPYPGFLSMNKLSHNIYIYIHIYIHRFLLLCLVEVMLCYEVLLCARGLLPIFFRVVSLALHSKGVKWTSLLMHLSNAFIGILR